MLYCTTLDHKGLVKTTRKVDLEVSKAIHQNPDHDFFLRRTKEGVQVLCPRPLLLSEGIIMNLLYQHHKNLRLQARVSERLGIHLQTFQTQEELFLHYAQFRKGGTTHE